MTIAASVRLAAALLLLAVCGTGAALAQACRGPEDLGRPAPPPPLQADQFGRTAAGAGLGCALPPDRPGTEVHPIPYLACLRIGAVGIGDDIKAVEQVLGAPDRVTRLPGDVDLRVYFIRQPGAPQPYYVVTVREDRVVALQLHGPATVMPLAFSSLSLGTPAQRVLDVLGAPERHCVDVSRDLDTWYYPPYPFTLDLADGVLIGIRMSVPVTASDGGE
jgi:hypothetical protein